LLGRRIIRLCSLLVFISFAESALSQESVIPDESLSLLKSIPEETEKNWVVGFSSFKAIAVTKEHRYLVHSIPLLLREELRSLDLHCLGVEEKEAYRKDIVKNQIHNYLKDLEKIQQEEQDMLFSQDKDPYNPMEARKSLAELGRKKRAIRDAVQWLRELPRDRIAVTEEKPIVFEEGEEKGTLLFSPRLSPSGLAKRENLDFLVWGEVEEIQGYLFMKIRGYNSVLGREVYAYEIGGSPEELQTALEEAIYGLAEQILGRPWASLAVEPQPAGSSVIINEIFKGVGKIRARFLRPGRVRVLVRALGYIEQEREYMLSPYEKRAVSIELQQKQTIALTVTTHPEGADVYLDSRWSGITPLELDLVYPEQRLILKKEGFKDLVYDIDESTPSVLDLTLRKQILDEIYWQEKKRDSFYSSLGIWAVSLPFPIFLYGYAVDNARAANRSTPGTEEYKRFRRNTELTYAGYFATLFISVTLFVKMFLNMLEYVDFVKYSSQQIGGPGAR
jgi:hypothetical protein